MKRFNLFIALSCAAMASCPSAADFTRFASEGDSKILNDSVVCSTQALENHGVDTNKLNYDWYKDISALDGKPVGVESSAHVQGANSICWIGTDWQGFESNKDIKDHPDFRYSNDHKTRLSLNCPTQIARDLAVELPLRHVGDNKEPYRPTCKYPDRFGTQSNKAYPSKYCFEPLEAQALWQNAEYENSDPKAAKKKLFPEYYFKGGEDLRVFTYDFSNTTTITFSPCSRFSPADTCRPIYNNMSDDELGGNFLGSKINYGTAEGTTTTLAKVVDANGQYPFKIEELLVQKPDGYWQKFSGKIQAKFDEMNPFNNANLGNGAFVELRSVDNGRHEIWENSCQNKEGTDDDKGINVCYMPWMSIKLKNDGCKEDMLYKITTTTPELFYQGTSSASDNSPHDTWYHNPELAINCSTSAEFKGDESLNSYWGKIITKYYQDNIKDGVLGRYIPRPSLVSPQKCEANWYRHLAVKYSFRARQFLRNKNVLTYWIHIKGEGENGKKSCIHKERHPVAEFKTYHYPSTDSSNPNNANIAKTARSGTGLSKGLLTRISGTNYAFSFDLPSESVKAIVLDTGSKPHTIVNGYVNTPEDVSNDAEYADFKTSPNAKIYSVYNWTTINSNPTKRQIMVQINNLTTSDVDALNFKLKYIYDDYGSLSAVDVNHEPITLRPKYIQIKDSSLEPYVNDALNINFSGAVGVNDLAKPLIIDSQNPDNKYSFKDLMFIFNLNGTYYAFKEKTPNLSYASNDSANNTVTTNFFLLPKDLRFSLIDTTLINYLTSLGKNPADFCHVDNKFGIDKNNEVDPLDGKISCSAMANAKINPKNITTSKKLELNIDRYGRLNSLIANNPYFRLRADYSFKQLNSQGVAIAYEDTATYTEPASIKAIDASGTSVAANLAQVSCKGNLSDFTYICTPSGALDTNEVKIDSANSLKDFALMVDSLCKDSICAKGKEGDYIRFNGSVYASSLKDKRLDRAHEEFGANEFDAMDEIKPRSELKYSENYYSHRITKRIGFNTPISDFRQKAYKLAFNFAGINKDIWVINPILAISDIKAKSNSTKLEFRFTDAKTNNIELKYKDKDSHVKALEFKPGCSVANGLNACFSTNHASKAAGTSVDEMLANELIYGDLSYASGMGHKLELASSYKNQITYTPNSIEVINLAPVGYTKDVIKCTNGMFKCFDFSIEWRE